MRKIITCLFISFLCLSSIAHANPLKKLYETGLFSYKQGMYKKAISIFEEALKVYPNFAPSYNYIGLCHKALGDSPKKVIDFFKKSIEINPEYAYAYDNLSREYYQLGKFDKAEEAELKALKLMPNLTSAKLSLAWIYLIGQSKPDEAAKYFEDVLKTSDNTYALFGLGISYFMNNDRLKVFDIITSLRAKGKEKMAVQLETMLRTNKLAPDLKEGNPLFVSSRPKIISDEDFPDFEHFRDEENKFSDVNQMKVRLKEDINLNDRNNSSYGKRIESGEDRIKTLQMNSHNTPKSKYYY